MTRRARTAFIAVAGLLAVVSGALASIFVMTIVGLLGLVIVSSAWLGARDPSSLWPGITMAVIGASGGALGWHALRRARSGSGHALQARPITHATEG